VGRLASFTGSMLALGLMSLVGVAIGSTLAAAPPEWSSGECRVLMRGFSSCVEMCG
jgi:hypothetical protein